MNILSIGTHPDDIEIGCGGAELKAIQSGHDVYHVVLTSGESGSREIDKRQLREIREQEAKKAGSLIGVTETFFLGEPDGLTNYSMEAKEEMMKIIREIKPELIFVHSDCDQFPDHRICHELVMAAVIGASGPWYQEIDLPPWSTPIILGYEVWNPINHPNLFIEIDSFIENKLRALKAHKSQMKEINYSEAILGLNRYRGVISFSSQYAEAFKILKMSTNSNLLALFR